MAEYIEIHLPQAERTLRAPAGSNLLEVLQKAGLAPPSPCGGAGICGRCRVRLDREEALACTARPEKSCTVELPDAHGSEAFAILEDYGETSPLPSSETGYALAVDIGTTTVVAQLLCLEEGRSVAATSFVNPQRVFGADVITRIAKSEAGALPALTACLRERLVPALQALCRRAGIAAADLVRIVIAGNTTMMYLLLGLDCGSLGKYPFTPRTPHRERYSSREVLGVNLTDAPIHLVPWISAFVGGDVVAGLLHVAPQAPRNYLLLDIGTNGELALCADGRLLSTSTAAGPAFEGGNISWGVGGIPGAIQRVDYENGAFRIDTIAGAPPLGLCGSGVLDAAACLIRSGLADETGLLEDEGHFERGVPIARTQAGETIVFTQKDLRELQLAKAAIRAGIDILLGEAGLALSQLDAVYLSGGFGRHLRLESALAIGLLPGEFAALTQPCGNSALGGAARVCLNPALLPQASDLAGRADELNLSAHPDFNNLFMEYMSFE